MSDAEHLSGVHFTVVEHVQDVHLEFERTDLQFFEEGGLTGGDFVTFGDDLNGVDDFDLGFDDLGLDVKGLEELGLFGVHTGGTSGNGHINRGKSTNFSGGLTDLGVNDSLDLTEVTFGEDETNVKNESVVDDLKVRAGFLLLSILIHNVLDSGFHQGLKMSYLGLECHLRSFP